MSRDNIIIEISKPLDLKKITDDTKYINIDIVNPNQKIITFFRENGKNFSYSDLIENHKGYIYVNYETFLVADQQFNNIINSMPENLNHIEKAKYLYVKLGKILGYDINSVMDKNETFNFSMINIVNNIWGSLENGKATNVSFCKAYMYLCRLANLDCEIVMTNDDGYLCNKLTIDNQVLIVDLTKDASFIQAGFKTRYFAPYNDDIALDRKIGYVDEYSEILIEKALKKINYTDNNFIYELLKVTQNIINVKDIKPVELGMIYDLIFKKYCPNYDVRINNLYLNDIYSIKEHFILITYGDLYYSFNYKKNSFIELSKLDLVNNISANRIGIYLNEELPLFSYQNKI